MPARSTASRPRRGGARGRSVSAGAGRARLRRTERDRGSADADRRRRSSESSDTWSGSARRTSGSIRRTANAPELCFFPASVRSGYEVGPNVRSYDRPLAMRIPAVVGRREDGSFACVLPTLDSRFQCDSRKSVERVARDHVRQRLDGLEPRALSRFLMARSYRLDAVIVSGVARREERRVPRLPTLRRIAEPLVGASMRRKLGGVWRRDDEIAAVAKRLQRERTSVLSSARAASARLRRWGGMQYLGQWQQRCEAYRRRAEQRLGRPVHRQPGRVDSRRGGGSLGQRRVVLRVVPGTRRAAHRGRGDSRGARCQPAAAARSRVPLSRRAHRPVRAARPRRLCWARRPRRRNGRPGSSARRACRARCSTSFAASCRTTRFRGERELIRERTVAGLKAARARGRRGGRKFALTEAQVRLGPAAKPEDRGARAKRRISVRRDKAPFHSGCESRPATVAPAGSSRSGRWR